MHPACGNQKAIINSLQDFSTRAASNPADVRAQLVPVVGEANADAALARITTQVNAALVQAQGEQSDDIHYVSRFDAVGQFQSALAVIFADLPDLQGLGDLNPAWFTTLVEGAVHDIKTFFERIRADVAGGQTVWGSIIQELAKLPAVGFHAPFPPGTPATIPIPEDVKIALLADWGGDNPAAKNVADVVRKQNPKIAIHLGDVYYGGAESECRAFLANWPMPEPRTGNSYAMNGNHEMYCGGQYYFDLILKDFGQPQSFFCLENTYWRIIGLDSAYGGAGTLKPKPPEDPNDPLTAQWNWLIALLKKNDGKANILLTHHQPVSAHKSDSDDAATLRGEINGILGNNGVPSDAIFAWFFGHEHRCAIYQDSKTPPYNARLIGNGCIPHEVQKELAADDGCTPFAYVNRLAIAGTSNAAVSSFASLHFEGYEVQIDYLDENFNTLRTETWSQKTGRLNPRFPFQEYDGEQGAAEENAAGAA